MKMSDEELVSLVDGEFTSAMGAPGGDISTERADAWDYYLAKSFGNEVSGQSEVVTSDVADTIDGMMPSLLRIFTIAENLVEFDPTGPEDIEAARQESDYVNHVFFQQNPAFLILYTWFFDALVQKNGVVKAWWDESEVVTTESYQGLTDAELAQLLADDELEPVERAERDGIDLGGVVIEGEPPSKELRGTLHDVVFKRRTRTGRVRVEPVPPEEYRISADAHSLDPSAARMVGQEREITRSELIEMGFDRAIVDDLPAEDREANGSDEDIARRDKSDDTRDTARDPSQDKILVREAYIRVDRDGDGVAELRQVFTSAGTLLSDEEADRSPFHVISPQPLPHKHFGRSLAEKVMDIQKVNSTLVRQILDNLYHTNNPGHAVWEQGIGDYTLDDLLTRRAGQVARFERPPAESWMPMTVPFTAGATFPMLEFFERAKRHRSGVSGDGEGLNPEALKNIQSSVLAQASDISRMKMEAVARIFAETGIKSLFLHIHELLLKHQKKSEIVLLRNQWVPVDPREWRTRHNMTVRIGLGIGTREANLLHLNAIWEKQRDLIGAGGLGSIVTPRNLYNTAAELVRNANLKTPEMFFTETDAMQPPPDEQQQATQALVERQQQLDAQRQALDAEKLSLQHQREMLKIENQRQANEDRLLIEMEKIRNQLTELDLEFRGQNVPGSRV